MGEHEYRESRLKKKNPDKWTHSAKVGFKKKLESIQEELLDEYIEEVIEEKDKH